MILRILISAFWMGCTINYSAAQENYTLRTYTTKDGLPHNQVLSIAQDSTGFLWIATWDGLSRYDGYEFKNFYHNPLDTASIPNFTVNDLAVSNDNELFVSCTTFPPAIFVSPDERFLKTIPHKIYKDHSLSVTPSGDVYFYHPGQGLMRWDQVKLQPVPVNIYHKSGEKALLSDLNGLKICFDNLGNLWILQSISNEIEAFVAEMKRDSGNVKQIFRLPNPSYPYNTKGLSPPPWFTPYIIPSKDTFIVTISGLSRISCGFPGMLIPFSKSRFQENQSVSSSLLWSD